MKKIIMTICITLLKVILSIIYFFMKLFPTKNKIIMVSRQSNSISLDFELLDEALKKNCNAKIIILCKKIEKGFIKKINYCFYLLKVMMHLATSKVCIIDGYCIPVSVLKHKKNLKIVQIWHASGAVKKFGYQVIGTEEGTSELLANLMRMHKNYDYVLSPSSITSKVYSEAFHVQLQNIKLLGLPRLQYLVEKNNIKKQILIDNPNLKGKKIILYVPTFRKEKNVNLNEIYKSKIDENKYALIVKLHPLDTNHLKEKYKIKGNYSTYDLAKIADYIITDYSVLLIEASILNKPIYLYIYDYNEYSKDRGLNIDIKKEFPKITHMHFNTIIQSIEKNDYDKKNIKYIKDKYIEIDPKKCIHELTDFIVHLL